MLFDATALRKNYVLRQLPRVDSTWTPPKYYPNLSQAQVIGFDVETFDPELLEHGPGWSRYRGHIVGISIAALASNGERGKWYFPIRHEVGTEHNLSARHTIAWLKETLQDTPHIPKVAANILYDYGWLTEEGITVRGELHDVQFIEALLGDDNFVALDHLGQKYLNRGKTDAELEAWCFAAYGKCPDQRANIYRAPPAIVGPYAEDDADMPLDILPLQWPQMVAQELVPIYRMECGLVPLLTAMRRRGVPVNIPKAEKLYDSLTPKIKELYARLGREYGTNIDKSGSGAQLAKLFDAAGLQYPKTAHGNPSFQKEFLKSLNHPVADAINEIRLYEKTQSTFLRGCLLEGHVNGVVHCSFHPLRSDDGGTMTGRFSVSQPPLQQIPVRTDLGRQVRECFMPLHVWRKIDYSQVEYRMLAHYAVDGEYVATDLNRLHDFWKGIVPTWGGDGSSDALRASYVNNPDVDYHQFVMDNVAPLLGYDLSKMTKSEIALFRKPIKNINFGLLYGETEKGLAYKSGLTQDKARAFFAAYHAAAPYVKPTMRAIQAVTNAQGYIDTLLGRRTRFDLWELDEYKKTIGLPYDAAIRNYGSRIRRAYTYRAVNYRFQGSGTGDVIKAAMLNAWNAGIYEVIGVPGLQVHDELGHDLLAPPVDHAEAWREYMHILENSIPGLRVPIKVDVKDGPNWGAID